MNDWSSMAWASERRLTSSRHCRRRICTQSIYKPSTRTDYLLVAFAPPPRCPWRYESWISINSTELHKRVSLEETYSDFGKHLELYLMGRVGKVVVEDKYPNNRKQTNGGIYILLYWWFIWSFYMFLHVFWTNTGCPFIHSLVRELTCYNDFGLFMLSYQNCFPVNAGHCSPYIC